MGSIGSNRPFQSYSNEQLQQTYSDYMKAGNVEGVNEITKEIAERGKTNNIVTTTSIPSLSTDNIQKFVEQFETTMKVEQLAHRVYDALPVTGSVSILGQTAPNKGVSILNDKYITIDNGPTLQFVRRKGAWKVKEF